MLTVLNLVTRASISSYSLVRRTGSAASWLRSSASRVWMRRFSRATTSATKRRHSRCWTVTLICSMRSEPRRARIAGSIFAPAISSSHVTGGGQKRKLDLLNSSHRQWLLQHWKQPFEQLLRSIFDF